MNGARPHREDEGRTLAPHRHPVSESREPKNHRALMYETGASECHCRVATPFVATRVMEGRETSCRTVQALRVVSLHVSEGRRSPSRVSECHCCTATPFATARVTEGRERRRVQVPHPGFAPRLRREMISDVTAAMPESLSRCRSFAGLKPASRELRRCSTARPFETCGAENCGFHSIVDGELASDDSYRGVGV